MSGIKHYALRYVNGASTCWSAPNKIGRMYYLPKGVSSLPVSKNTVFTTGFQLPIYLTEMQYLLTDSKNTSVSIINQQNNKQAVGDLRNLKWCTFMDLLHGSWHSSFRCHSQHSTCKWRKVSTWSEGSATRTLPKPSRHPVHLRVTTATLILRFRHRLQHLHQNQAWLQPWNSPQHWNSPCVANTSTVACSLPTPAMPDTMRKWHSSRQESSDSPMRHYWHEAQATKRLTAELA